EGKEEEIRKKALAIFKVLDCYGLSRVDFFLTKDTNEVVFNEINTIPGFTAISMYPMLWEAKGIGKEQLVSRLIQSAFTRNN
ncbi:MAG: D-alanine--D-alanine ligase A, partial [Lachnospiraceae bacterium]|nr:D-alanine--D-alanine ligase A [Lachnospiraceae bacterium]